MCVSMSCHGMAWFGQIGDDGLLQTLSMVLGRMQEVQRGTCDDLGSMREAMIHWFLQCVELADSCTQGARPNGRMNSNLKFFSEFWWVAII